MSWAEALAVAREAAALAVPHMRDALGTIRADEAETKSGPADLVTIVDRTVEAEVVRLLQARTPSIPVLGEEGGRSGPVGAGLLWVLDPLDGTNNFAHGIPLHCFCLALLEDGRPVVGVIADPQRGELFSAVRGEGAWLETGAGARLESGGEPVRLELGAPGGSTGAGGVDGAAAAAGAPTATAAPAAADALTAAAAVGTAESPLASGLTLLEVGGGWPFAHFHQVWSGLAAAGSAVRVLGSAGLSLAWLAAGRATTLAFGRMQPWDIGAGLLLVEEAGGVVTGWDGDADVMSGSPLLAATNEARLAALRGLVGRVAEASREH